MKNEKTILIEKCGHGRYRITASMFRTQHTTVTNDSQAVDAYNDWDNTIRHNRGYRALIREISKSYYQAL